MSIFVLGPTNRLDAGPTPYLVDCWGSQEGLPNSIVTSIAQTPDGYLWVGTHAGLARFDGMRFVTFDPANTPALDYARIQDLFVDTGGTLWINTYHDGLTSYQNGVFRHEWSGHGEESAHSYLAYSSSNSVVFVTYTGTVLRRRSSAGTNEALSVLLPPEGRQLLYQCAEPDGTLWFLTFDGRIVRVENGRFREDPGSLGLAEQRVLTLAADVQGSIWAGTDRGVALWDGRQFQTMTPTNGEPKFEAAFLFPTRDGGVWVMAGARLRKQIGRQWIAEASDWQGLLGWAIQHGKVFHEDRDGGAWWFSDYGQGLFHVTPDGQFQRLTERDGLPGQLIWAWFQGREGEVWVGVHRGGLARLRPRQFQVVGMPEGLPTAAVSSVCEDNTGKIWFGTAGGGLCRWSGGRIERFAASTSASASHVFSVFPRVDDGLWCSAGASKEDLFEFRDGHLQPSPWAVTAVKVILVDHAGRLWTGTKDGLSWRSAERCKVFGASDGWVASLPVWAVAEDRAGHVWCGADDGALYRCEPERLEVFRPNDALARQSIWSLLADKDGTIWAGTFRGGLLRFRGGRFARLTTEQGLPSDTIPQLLEDTQGKLWLGTAQGICRVGKAALNACADGEARRVDCITYGRLDGLPTLECSGGFQPACWRGRDGRLWFATVKGVVSVKPDELKLNPILPSVVIEELRVDGRLAKPAAHRFTVPPEHRQFEFRFTALSLLAPDKVRLRYRLDGLDPDWVQAESRRTAQYNYLPAGDYRFRVVACNNDGVWNETGSAMALTVLPHFYQTWWFRVLGSLGFVGGVAAAARAVARRKYRAALVQLEKRHAVERDRARIAKDIHDDLGAGLTRIALLSELARRETPERADLQLSRISNSAREMTQAMDEIVWAVDPRQDTIEGLVDYVSGFAEEFLAAASVGCRLALPVSVPALRLDAEVRYNLFLAFKEALNNVVKHANATEAWVRVRLESDSLIVIVEDNGCGLPPDGAAKGGQHIVAGHGLLNMGERLAAIGGRCIVGGAPAHGTCVTMVVPLKAAV